MDLEITVTSQELVKPSSLNLNHLPDGCHHLSFLDMLSPPIFMPFLFFYHNQTNLSDIGRSDHIKSSLSEILNIYYPLAGRVKNSGDVVLCNDVGVSFVEAKAHCNMSQILENPNPNELNKFLPFEYDEVSDVPLKIQLTFFKCGGLALGVGLYHKLCDAMSGLIFIRSWADFARGDSDEIVTPSFDLAKMFPPCDMGNLNMAPAGITKENIVTRRFVFLKSSLESLRERFSGNMEIRATRIEALSAFLWSRFVASTNPDDKTEKIYSMIHVVNLRRKADPFIPDNVFGNILGFSVTVPKMVINDDDETTPSLVEQMRKEIRKVDTVYVKKIQEDSRGHLEFSNKQLSGMLSEGEIVSLGLSSLCRFPVYESDFGWGKPLWVSSARMSYKNMIALFDTKEGDGIEAWVHLTPNDMSRFETDEELLRYVSSSPSVNFPAS